MNCQHVFSGGGKIQNLIHIQIYGEYVLRVFFGGEEGKIRKFDSHQIYGGIFWWQRHLETEQKLVSKLLGF